MNRNTNRGLGLGPSLKKNVEIPFKAAVRTNYYFERMWPGSVLFISRKLVQIKTCLQTCLDALMTLFFLTFIFGNM